MAKAQTNEMNGNGKVYYKFTQLVGHRIGERYIPAEEMLEISVDYEKRLRRGYFKSVRKIENKENYPKTWLNFVISNLIKEDNGLAKKLTLEFANRGFRQV